MLNRCRLLTLILNVALMLSASDARALSPLDSALVALEVGKGGAQKSCKGLAVAQRTIITAAHCVIEQEIDSIQVKGLQGTSKVERLTIHPLYSTKFRIPHFDVALLGLADSITDDPLPIIVSSELRSGDTFSIFSLYGSDSEEFPRQLHEHRLVVAELEQTIKDYIELKRGNFLSSSPVKELEKLLDRGDSRIKKKMTAEFGGLLFTLFSKSGASICLGDSGSPAIVSQKGQMGVVGIATAVSQLELDKNPDCEAGGTSIFTSLNQEEIMLFIREFDSTIKFY